MLNEPKWGTKQDGLCGIIRVVKLIENIFPCYLRAGSRSERTLIRFNNVNRREKNLELDVNNDLFSGTCCYKNCCANT